MAVCRVQRMVLCGLKQDRKKILDILQQMNCFEPAKLMENTVFPKESQERTLSQLEQMKRDAKDSLVILNQHNQEDSGLKAGLCGKITFSPKERKELQANREKLLFVTREIIERQREYEKKQEQLEAIKDKLEAITPWLALSVPMREAKTRYTEVVLGSLPEQWSVERLYEVLQQEDRILCEPVIISQDKQKTYIAFVLFREQEETLKKRFKPLGMLPPAIDCLDYPLKAKEKWEKEYKVIKIRRKELRAEFESYEKYRKALEWFYDDCAARIEKYHLVQELSQSEQTFFLQGYILKNQIEQLRQQLAPYDVVMELNDIRPQEEAPVVLTNNSFSSSFKGVVEAFGLPGYHSLDPTTIMSFFYVFLFGLMLSDAAYGALIVIACGGLLLKYKNMQASLKQSIQLFFWCGWSTLIWGILFGGYFGDLITVVSRTFFGTEVEIPALWFVPLNNPMKLLMYSMLFGVIHLFTGLFLKGYELIRKGEIKAAILDVGLWFILLSGLLVLLLPSEIFSSIAGTHFEFPEWLNQLGLYGSIVSAAGIFLFAGRHSKNWGVRLALGAYDLYNITGWLSDVLSYSRLLALGLATGVIAQVVNQMGSMLGNSIWGVLLFIIVFIIGHSLNLAINLLGAYVHTNRLQYVEFFGKFYEGGGKVFQPFGYHTKYVHVAGDNGE